MEGSVYFFNNVPELRSNRDMKKLEIHSPSFDVFLNGNIGFLYEIGGEKGIDTTLRKTMEKLIPIHYNQKVRSIRQLEKFDAIVAADGYHSRIAKEVGLRSSSAKQIGVGVGLTVEGNFHPEWMAIWFNNYLSLHGYAYVIPFSENEASLVSASISKSVPIRTYRKRLKEFAIDKGWRILNEWVDFESWFDFKSYHKDNVYVIGNAGSFTEPAFGFGLKYAIKSAKLCAKAIHQNLDYDVLIEKDLLPEFGSWQVMRRFFESADNEDYDRFVNCFNTPQTKILVESGRSILVKLKAKEANQRMIFVPRTLSLGEFLNEESKGLVAIAYCVKPFDCPKGRYSESCDPDCSLCDMSKMMKKSQEVGFDFKISTEDDSFIRFLKDNVSKYKRLIAITCPYTFNKIAYPVHLIFGLRGFVIPLRGDTCNSEDKYMKGVKGEKSSQTKTDLNTFFEVMEKIRVQKET